MSFTIASRIPSVFYCYYNICKKNKKRSTFIYHAKRLKFSVEKLSTLKVISLWLSVLHMKQKLERPDHISMQMAAPLQLKAEHTPTTTKLGPKDRLSSRRGVIADAAYKRPPPSQPRHSKLR